MHPSSILRAPDGDARHEQQAEFLADFKKIAALKLWSVVPTKRRETPHAKTACGAPEERAD
jgi:hypothetical protein